MRPLDLTVRATTPLEWSRKDPRASSASAHHQRPSSQLSMSGSAMSRQNSSGSISTEHTGTDGRKGVPKLAPAQSRVWRPSTANNIQRNDSNQGGRKPKSQINKKYKFRKGKTEVDEELFGKSKHLSAEAMHRTYYSGDAEFCKKKSNHKKAASSPQQSTTTTSNRLDLTTPIHVPRTFVGEAGQRFKRTNTLQGGYDPPPRKPQGDDPYKLNLAVHLRHEVHHPTRQAPPPMHHPHIPKPIDPAPRQRIGARMQNNLWGSVWVKDSSSDCELWN